MKKLLLGITCVVAGAFTASAQCTPDPQYTNSGIYPDSATNFLPACAGEPYMQLITNVVPVDTTVTIQILPAPAPPNTLTVNIDSINVVSVTGLPPGMTFACTPPSCSFPGGQSGCATISGTCTTPGTYNLVIDLKAYVQTVGAQDFTLDYYKIVVSDCGTASLIENETSAFKLYPNPANTEVNIEGLDANLAVESISIHNSTGQLVQNTVWNGASSMKINTSNFENGLYFITVNHATGSEVLKLIKE